MANAISILIEAKDGASGVIRDVASHINAIGTASDETTTKVGSFSTRSAALFGVVAGAAQNLVSQGISMISSAVTDAAKRVDTLNNSNRTFENMGFSAQATKNMMHELDLSIRGLPTTLSDAVTGVELLAGSTNDIGQSRKIFDALNDGIIGFGGSAVQVNGAIIQLSQAFSNGKVDAQTWNSLIQNGMGPALDAIARKMGLTIGAFKDGLSTGKISVKDFQDALIDLDIKGGGGMSSLNKIAHDSTSGIETGIANARTAITRGIADIITAIGSKNISTAIADVGKAFETVAKKIPEYVKTAVEFLQQHHMALAMVAGVIVTVVIPAFFALAGSIVAAFLPLIPFIAIGTAVGAVAQLLIHHFGGLAVVTRELELGVRAFFLALRDGDVTSDGFVGVMERIGNTIRDVRLGFLAFFAAFKEGDVTSDGFVGVMERLGVALGNAWRAAEPFIVAIGSGLVQAISAASGAIAGLFKWLSDLGIIQIIGQYISQIFWPAVMAVAAAIWQNLGPALAQLWTAVTRLWNALNPALTDTLKVLATILSALLFAAIWLVISALNVIIQVFAAVVSVISNVINWISNLIAWFGNLVGIVANTVGAVISIIRNLVPAFRDVVGIIGSVVGAVAGLIVSPFRAAYDAIIGLFRGLPGAIGSIVRGAFGSVGSAVSGTLHGLHIPGFASGTMSAPGGLAVVGESGPELVNLPRGSQVYTASQSRQMAGGTTNILSGNFTFNNKESVDAFFNRLDKTQRLASMGMA